MAMTDCFEQRDLLETVYDHVMKTLSELLTAADHMIDWYRIRNPTIHTLWLSPEDFVTYEQHAGTHGITRSGNDLTYREFLLKREDRRRHAS